MSLINATLLAAPTSMSAVGGTTFTYTGMGIQNNSLKAVVTADSDLRTRRFFIAKAKETKANTNSVGGYTMQRNSLKFVFPKLITVGTQDQISANYVSIEIGYDPRSTAAEKQQLVDACAQAGFDVDFISFLKDGNMA